MTDFENRIRESLRPATSLPIPVAPLDPQDIADRAGGRPHRTGLRRGWLAAAAAVALVAGIGLTASFWTGRTQGVPAVPIAPASSASTQAQTTVLVQLFSGREDPQVNLDAKVAGELYAMLADQEGAGLLKRSESPSDNLGFRGFLVTPADTSLPVLRILPTAVYLERSGTYRLDDPNQNFYNRVYDAIGSQLEASVRAALPDSEPAIPTVSASVPPQVGATATWTLTQPDSIDPHTQFFEIFVTRLECASGKTGQLLKPVISVGEKEVVIRVDAKVRPAGADTCQSNDKVRVSIQLAEPLGNRSLVDAACLAGEAVRTSSCSDGAVRWHP